MGLKRPDDLVWQRGFEDGMEGAMQVVKRMQIAMKKNPMRTQPYWCGYIAAVNIAYTHVKTLMLQSTNKGH